MKWVSSLLPTPAIFDSPPKHPTHSYVPIKDQAQEPEVDPEPEPESKPEPRPACKPEPAPVCKPVIPSFSDPKDSARIHYPELQQYLVEYLAKQPADSRLNARQKLTRLTVQQFHELSTDVYDDLIRRKTNTPEKMVPWLPIRDEFHPKRNQARQKLATLPTHRFQDLASDVYVELVRRYPEVKEEENNVGHTPPNTKEYLDK